MNKKVIKIVALVALSYLAIYFVIRLINKSKWLKYLHELGMNIADTFNYKELKIAYTFLYDYARKYSSNAWSILKAQDPKMYAEAVALGNKYKIFSIPVNSTFTTVGDNTPTNIPNINIDATDPITTIGI